MVPRIIAVQPSSGKGETVVVEVQQQGSHPLDLRLVGCEGENPYVATRKSDQFGLSTLLMCPKSSSAILGN